MDVASIELKVGKDTDVVEALSVALSAFGTLSETLEQFDYPLLSKNLRNVFLREIDRVVLLALYQGKAVGTVVYNGPNKNTSVFPKTWSFVRSMAVIKEFTGLGIGNALTSWCIDLARQDGAEAVGLYTARQNTAARHLYESLGFTQYGEALRKYNIDYITMKTDTRSWTHL